MNPILAVNNKVLDVNLTNGSVGHIEISHRDRKDYIGGKGLAIKLLYDHMAVGVDPLSPENIIVMMTGPAAGTPSPAGGRFAVVSKSPLTGIFASSYIGGKFGLSLKKAGYDGVMVRGRSEKPVYLSIHNGEVRIKDAAELWGMDTYEVQEKVKDEGDWVVIGPAGENLVKYSILVSKKRVAGRCGLGAVMGSKNLKGIVARGDLKFKAVNQGDFKKALKIAQKKVKSHTNTGSRLQELGTAQNVNVFGKTAIMPVKNFSKPYFDKMKDIDAETIRDNHTVKNHGCTGCPIKCGRTGKFNGKEMVSPEYETIGLMGSNLLISDINVIAHWNDKLNRLGLDSISTGSCIGFAMELNEKNMLKQKSDLAFGDAESVEKIIDDIAYRKGLGNELAEGVKRFSKKHGGEDFANHVKGLEIPAYDPRGCTGQGLGYATANCGATHLSGSTHAVEVDPLGGGAESYLSPHGSKAKAHFVVFLQDVNEIVNSSIFCIQTQYPFLEENIMYQKTPPQILRFIMRNFPSVAVKTTDLSDYVALLSSILGIKFSRNSLYSVGERIYQLERYMNCLEGINRKDDTLPKRMLEEVSEEGWGTIELDTMLDKYYKLRGWDQNGIPRERTLKKFGIVEK